MLFNNQFSGKRNLFTNDTADIAARCDPVSTIHILGTKVYSSIGWIYLKRSSPIYSVLLLR